VFYPLSKSKKWMDLLSVHIKRIITNRRAVKMQYDYSKNKEEKPDPVKADVKGTLPAWLQGTLLRNGPGMFSVGETSYNHWFDGLALLHSFTFKDGDVFYRSKFLRGDTYKCNMEANRIVVSEMGTMAYPDPCKNIFSNFFCRFTIAEHSPIYFTDNCGTNIIKYGEDYYATSETNYIRKIDHDTLETYEKVDYLKYIAVNLVTSHPHYGKDGSSYNMGTSIADKGKTRYSIFKIPPTAQDKKSPSLKDLEVICSVPCRSLLTPSYYHSFGMTDNYIIFIEQPFKLDILKMATAYFRGVNWASCLNFHSNDNTLIHLIDRKTHKPVPTKFITDALVVYHHVNAYEEDGHVVFDVIAYKDNSLYDMFYLANLQGGLDQPKKMGKLTSKPEYKRFVLPLHSDKGVDVGSDLVKLKSTTAAALKEKEGKLYCKPEILFEANLWWLNLSGVELPRINYDFNGKKHRYVYVTGVELSPVPTKIMKLDVETKQMVEWSEENCWPSEPVFIPAPNPLEEDDGVVLSVVVCPEPGKSSFLLVQDARSFGEIARASVDTDIHIDMHGVFVPQRT
uniref:Beta-carotene oxygenase 1 n=1 Tax=Lepisosteus oculatus TaxID=7918 RepID=W5M8E4_LEPOC